MMPRPPHLNNAFAALEEAGSSSSSSQEEEAGSSSSQEEEEGEMEQHPIEHWILVTTPIPAAAGEAKVVAPTPILPIARQEYWKEDDDDIPPPQHKRVVGNDAKAKSHKAVKQREYAMGKRQAQREKQSSVR
jgi:hypothetical protein